ncbi:D-alanine--D-alanine ligase [Hirschia baltica]|uniref:D-alanine--D-alanine ligase n=1 Tax=Hirschia baltica (strain ATCC 49814 / DSM 5838 / IFAM 1418) TaxID=582402 RepID=C6XMG2_HIRBI|nr:D-alanine--D-alanine ligase [Hirschia baltica]ACT58105.1 D-alanine/D-alanine ligase [Hirschia baltica ATCC 49814]
MNRVAVIMGGWSSEREVSLSSGRGMAQAARNEGFDVVEIDITRDLSNQLKEANPDVVLNALHGPYGEDGCVQGLLEILEIPYSHSGVLASALAMDKAKSRNVYARMGLLVAEGGVYAKEDVAAEHVMKPPYVVKPIAEGSSFGVLIVPEGANRPPAELLDPKWGFGDSVLVEQFIPGRELTVSVMGNEALAVTEITTLRDYYDYSAKYEAGGSKHVIPAEISDAVTQAALDAALIAHDALGCRGVSRSDFRYDDDTKRLVILETNTQPGMTPTSLVPEQAAHKGISYEKLVRWMIEDASCHR